MKEMFVVNIVEVWFIRRNNRVIRRIIVNYVLCLWYFFNLYFLCVLCMFVVKGDGLGILSFDCCGVVWFFFMLFILLDFIFLFLGL